jgi:hypothetical protein
VATPDLPCQAPLTSSLFKAFFEIMKNPSKEVAEAGKSVGVRPETAVVFIER